MRLLDLFCGAGGSAVGYSRAGFDEIVGVDLEPQPNYPFTFVQADALEFPLEGFDVIHASPPCQHHANVTRWRGDPGKHPDLLTPTLARLTAIATVPWVVENVPGAPLRPDLILCGTTFGLSLRRHRWFQTSWKAFELAPPCLHGTSDYSFDHGGKQRESVYRDAMGCGWMTVEESRQAIPPAYTEFIGRQLIQQLERVA